MNGDENQQPVPGQPGGNWGYNPEQPSAPDAGQSPQAPQPTAPLETEVTWTASEFIARHKGVNWYLMLTLGAIVASVLIYLLSRDFITVGAVVGAIILFGVAAARKPRILTYRMNEGGLTIGQKFYPYTMFKSFSVMDEDAFSSIMLLPLKRFMPPLSIYFEPNDEEHIVTILSHYLPMENRPADAVDRLMKHIRF
jgi:hypothetical protein